SEGAAPGGPRTSGALPSPPAARGRRRRAAGMWPRGAPYGGVTRPPGECRDGRGAESGAVMSGGAVRVVALAAGQNVLHPHSPAEHRITVLWWVMLGVAAVGFALVAVLLALGWIRRNRAALPFGGGERGATALV